MIGGSMIWTPNSFKMPEIGLLAVSLLLTTFN